MRSGLTDGVVRQDKHYVIQTEDLGGPKYTVVTEIISGGQVLKKKIANYAKYRNSKAIDRLVDLLIRRLHQKTIADFMAELDIADEQEDEQELLRWLANTSEVLEHRSKPRLDLITFATYVHRDPSGKVDDTNLAHTLDISERGIRLQTKRAFAANDGLEIRLKIKTRVLQTKAEVVHCQAQEQGRFYVGAKFVDLTREDQQFLAQLVTQQERPA